MTLTLTYDLGLYTPASYGHDVYSHAKVQGQRSVGFEDKVETNGRTDGRRRSQYLARYAVGTYTIEPPAFVDGASISLFQYLRLDVTGVIASSQWRPL